ncbi:MULTISPECIES: hypothetical protein [unclassified Cryobacterium]|uniref:hypothetical protein n=1 Tax=unclassified Cryobacterium TaxID=2649013 RepID=UPI00106ADA6D|nr:MULTISPECIES: hypothetical protein [unclassified Cryobacterium]TFC59411.1 hypothetical protein E3O68_00485 [Cryobacterium sp. TMB3-1-2]TFC67207.1 hypothetical protein E3T21_17180 [Cryobacterium sp. TMB3-15]TFC73280.1 hypothetical protein E3T22_16875 [Cryobacterium sp. TMB3-10]TFD46168.1 hypothetical protein E3T58_01510 [Cryobacterium sp. TMB3-12]
MTQRVYATGADFAAQAEDPFEGDAVKLAKRLRSASIEVEKLVRLSRYQADDDGYPTDTDISKTFTEATVAIVEHWAITDDPTGAESQQGAIKIGSVSLGTTSSNQGSASQRDKLIARIGEKAITILGNAGLLTAAVDH